MLSEVSGSSEQFQSQCSSNKPNKKSLNELQLQCLGRLNNPTVSKILSILSLPTFDRTNNVEVTTSVPVSVPVPVMPSNRWNSTMPFDSYLIGRGCDALHPSFTYSSEDNILGTTTNSTGSSSEDKDIYEYDDGAILDDETADALYAFAMDCEDSLYTETTHNVTTLSAPSIVTENKSLVHTLALVLNTDKLTDTDIVGVINIEDDPDLNLLITVDKKRKKASPTPRNRVRSFRKNKSIEVACVKFILRYGDIDQLSLLTDIELMKTNLNYCTVFNYSFEDVKMKTVNVDNSVNIKNNIVRPIDRREVINYSFAADEIGISRRRIYDVFTALQALSLISKSGKFVCWEKSNKLLFALGWIQLKGFIRHTDCCISNRIVMKDDFPNFLQMQQQQPMQSNQFNNSFVENNASFNISNSVPVESSIEFKTLVEFYAFSNITTLDSMKSTIFPTDYLNGEKSVGAGSQNRDFAGLKKAADASIVSSGVNVEENGSDGDLNESDGDCNDSDESDDEALMCENIVSELERREATKTPAKKRRKVNGNGKEFKQRALCEGFIELFLVGFDFISVASAIMLIEDIKPESNSADEAAKTVFDEDISTAALQKSKELRTKARRLYDFANILCCLGLLRKHQDIAAKKNPQSYSMSQKHKAKFVYQWISKYKPRDLFLECKDISVRNEENP